MAFQSVIEDDGGAGSDVGYTPQEPPVTTYTPKFNIDPSQSDPEGMDAYAAAQVEHSTAVQANADFQDLTSGIDPRALLHLLENEIQPTIIKTAKAALKGENNGYLENFKTTLATSWRGDARLKYIKKLDDEIQKICDDLDKEYNALYNRFSELEDNYRKQDIKMGENI